MLSNAANLKALLSQPGIIKCAGAHNAASARVAQNVGFDAIWSSSFEISTANCVPDASVLSMAEFLEVARSISSAVSVPVIADCDTGYGNATNVAYAVRRFEAAGAEAICIEDQEFPKTCSLLPGGQALADIADFTAKIIAAKRAQSSEHFVVIARTEALITGAGLEEAMVRAEEYAKAGADAILVHWNKSSPIPIINFLSKWDRRIPTIVVPTTYGSLSALELENLGAKMVIYANQGIRSALQAMETTFRAILLDGTAIGVEPKIWALDRVFDLQQVSGWSEREAEGVHREVPHHQGQTVSQLGIVH